MALIQCSECHRDVSDKAAACPGCGNPIQSAPAKPAVAPSLSKSTKELILEKGLGEVAAKADSFSSKSGGKIMETVCEVLGGRQGAEWMAKRIATTDVTEKIVCESALTTAVANARIVLSSIGKPIDVKIESETPFLAALVGSGFLNMNPAVVCLEFFPVDETRTEITISATAKEGLIKQNTAGKIVARLKKLLNG